MSHEFHRPCVLGIFQQPYGQIFTFRRFLAQLPTTQRRVFLCRYWYFDSISAIATQFGFSESKVKSMLHRSRKRLRDLLNKEGFTI